MLGQESKRGGLEDGPVRIASSTRSEVGHWSMHLNRRTEAECDVYLGLAGRPATRLPEFHAPILRGVPQSHLATRHRLPPNNGSGANIDRG